MDHILEIFNKIIMIKDSNQMFVKEFMNGMMEKKNFVKKVVL